MMTAEALWLCHLCPTRRQLSNTPRIVILFFSLVSRMIVRVDSVFVRLGVPVMFDTLTHLFRQAGVPIKFDIWRKHFTHAELPVLSRDAICGLPAFITGSSPICGSISVSGKRWTCGLGVGWAPAGRLCHWTGIKTQCVCQWELCNTDHMTIIKLPLSLLLFILRKSGAIFAETRSKRQLTFVVSLYLLLRCSV